MYVKGEDGLYEVKTPLGSAWYSERVFKAAYEALQATGVDPETNPTALLFACAKELDKHIIPEAALIAELLVAGIGTKDPG